MKDERRYLEEYFGFYTNMGCDIIVHDNESTDDLKELTDKFDNVIYRWWLGRKDRLMHTKMRSIVIKAYIDFERNQLVKSIVIPERIAGWVDPHLPSSVLV